jgi:hypothetical protein
MSSETEQTGFAALAAQLASIKNDLAELKKAAAVSNAMAAIYQKYRLAFFGG